MAGRDITPYEPLGEIYGDEFRKERSYTNWRPSGSGDWLLIYTKEGSGHFTTHRHSTRTEAGDAVLYAPDESQDYATCEKIGHWNLLWAHFPAKVQWQPWLRWPLTNQGLRRLHLENGEVRERFEAAMQRMIVLLRRKIPGATDLAGNALEEALLWANVVVSQEKWTEIDPRIRKAIDYFSSQTREPFCLEKLARHCGSSVSHFASLFKKTTGTSPQRFLESLRLQHAKQLLQITSLPIAEIAQDCGYADAFYFSNRFHRFTGKSPSDFRRDQQKAP